MKIARAVNRILGRSDHDRATDSALDQMDSATQNLRGKLKELAESCAPINQAPNISTLPSPAPHKKKEEQRRANFRHAAQA
jgi:hypothetical protein